MNFSIILILLSLLFATTAKAGVFTTNPFGETNWQGGRLEKITWKESGTAPLLTTLLALKVDLYMGNDTVQTFITTIRANVKGTDKKLLYKVPKDIGPPGKYFIRYTDGVYKESSGVFNILGVNGDVPTQTSPLVSNSIPIFSTTATGNNPINSTPTSTPTGTATGTATGSKPTNSNGMQTQAPSTTPTSSFTTPSSISSSNIIYSNYLTLGSLMILGKILSKYL